MNLLALETATEACSSALWRDGIVTERFQLAPRRHAELILPMLDELLAEAGLRVIQLDAIAFGRGPGAFTGVRLAASVTQGIAFAAGLPVVPVSTLAALAYPALREPGVSYVAAALDARMGEVYWGLYQADAELGARLLGVESVCAPTAVTTITASGPWHGVGSGWAVYGAALTQRLPVLATWPEVYPRAAAVAELGVKLYQRGQSVTAAQALPVYLRDQVVSAAPL